jgi:hypothetical protein
MNEPESEVSVKGIETVCDERGREVHSQSPGRRTIAGLILFSISAIGVLLNLAGAICVEVDIIGGSDQLAVIALVSVPLIFVLLVIGAVLGTLDWRAALKTSRRPSRMTVAAASLNIALFVIGGGLALATLLFIVALMNSLPPL